MPDSPQAKSGWTVDTLHQHLDRLFTEFQKHVDEKFKAQAEEVKTALTATSKNTETAMTAASLAAEKAEQQGEKWRANANEWRAAMDDRERNFMPRVMGYVLSSLTLIVSIIALVLAFWQQGAKTHP